MANVIQYIIHTLHSVFNYQLTILLITELYVEHLKQEKTHKFLLFQGFVPSHVAFPHVQYMTGYNTEMRAYLICVCLLQRLGSVRVLNYVLLEGVESFLVTGQYNH